MSQLKDALTCPKCGAAMVRRERGSDGSPFWGCSRFPQCRGTRQLVDTGHTGPTFGPEATPERLRVRRFDGLVLACGRVGLVIGLGFIFVGLVAGPTAYGLLGAILVALVGLVVLPSPFLPRDFARASAVKVALFCVVAAVFVVALVPVSDWLAHYLSGAILHSIPTPSAAAPSLAR